MKKNIFMIAAGILCISIIMTLYNVVFFPVYYGKAELGYLLLRLALCLVFGWMLASHTHKKYAVNRKGTFSRFIKSTWIVLVILLVWGFLCLSDSFLRDFYTYGWLSAWDLFYNQGATFETYIFPGAAWNPVPIFICELFFAPFTHFSIAMMYLSYKLRAAQYASDGYAGKKGDLV